MNQWSSDDPYLQALADDILDRVGERLNQPFILRNIMAAMKAKRPPIQNISGESRQQRRYRERAEMKAAQARKVAL